MLKSLFDHVMEKRATQLIAQIRHALPDTGPILDLGSGTGHVAARLERDLGLRVITADVTDIHVTGRSPVRIDDGPLPFADDEFSAALLLFMLGYPQNPAAVLAEAARVANGRVILVQSLYSGHIGHLWHRSREFLWTIVAFQVSRLIGYVPADATFSMATRRFYTAEALLRDLKAAGLRVRSRRDRAVLPRRALVVSALELEHGD